MKGKTFAASAVLVIGLAVAGTAVVPASADTQAQPSVTQAHQVRYNVILPGINHFFAKPQTPPLEPLLRFYMVEHTNSYPKSWRAVFCLHRWRFDRRHFRWVPRLVFPCAHLGMGDLASPGDSVTWHLGDQPYPYWYCKRGRYFVSEGVHTVSSSGIPLHLLLFSPFHKGTRHGPAYQDWGRGVPTLRESHHQTSCKKVKGG